MPSRAILLAAAAALLAGGCSCDAKLGAASGEVTVEPAELDFGAIVLGGSARHAVRLENGGRTAVALAVQGLPAGFSAAPAQLSLPPGGSAEVEIVFRPATAGASRGSANFRGADAEVSVALSGVGEERILEHVTALDFGTVPAGTSRTLPLVLQSRATAALQVGAWLTGGDLFAYRLSRDRVELGAGERVEVEVTFTPLGRGEYSSMIELSTCTACQRTAVMLRGLGAKPELRLQPLALDFGKVTPGRSLSLPVRISNLGEMAGSITRFDFSSTTGPAFTSAPALPLEVAPGETVEMPVTFSPSNEERQAGELRLYSGDELVREIPLTGGAGGPNLAVFPLAIDFGEQPLDAVARRRVSVVNVGDRDPVWIEGVRVEGAGFQATTAGSLPLDVRVGSADIEIRFGSGSPGPYAGELVIVTSDRDSAELRIPLHALVRGEPACEVEARPPSVRFGLVAAGPAHQREVELVNVTATSCFLTGIALGPGAPATFSVPNPPAGRTLSPGESMKVAVAFTASQPSATVERAELQYTSPRSRPSQPVALSAYASAVKLQANPNPLDFGSAPLGYRPLRQLTVANRSQVPAEIERVEFAPGSSPRFEFFKPYTGISLAALAQTAYVLRFSPVQSGAHAAAVHLWLRSVPEPFIVQVTGVGNDQPCGELCDPPIATCPGSVVGRVNNPITVTGAGSHPAGEPVTCAWSVAQRPPGSTVQPAPADACTTTLLPDIVGTYLLELTVSTLSGDTAQCTTVVEAQPYGGLWIEMYWDKADDIDLHLLHPSGGDPNVKASWLTRPWDCYFSNRTPSWDAPGTQDDPGLDRDDTKTTGPENIRINEPVLTHRYTVGVHWYANANGLASVTATTNVYCGGQLLHTQRTLLTSVRQMVVLGDVQETATSCIWRPNGTVLP